MSMPRARARYAVRASEHLVPPTQCLFGADDTTRGFVTPNGIETQMGRTMGVRNRHYSWNAPVQNIAAQWAHDASVGAVPMVSLGGQGYSMTLVREIAGGKHDAYWQGLFHALAATSRAGLFRPWMEMNGNHNPYSGDPSAWIAMWLRVQALCDSIVTTRSDLTWIFCPQAADPKQVWPQYWPGDSHVDWMGLDLYRHPWSFGDPWRKWAVAHRKPYCICESGFEQGATVKDPVRGISLDKDGSKTGHSLIDDTRAQVKMSTNTVMYLVWNNVGPVGDDFIDTSRQSLDQYRNFAHDGYFKFGS